MKKPHNYTTGKSSYRKRALKWHGKRCQVENCDTADLFEDEPSVPEEMLDVHHIDGDRSNNEIENLMVCCCWCHRKMTAKLATLNENMELI